MPAHAKPIHHTAARRRAPTCAAAGLCLGLGLGPVWGQDVAPLQVRWGQTASAIAAAHQPAGATLNQVLLALLRNNPQAFIQDNVNLLRAGATLQLPSPEQVLALSPEQASQAVRAQEAAFDAHRRRAASAKPAQAQGGADRQAGGPILDAQDPGRQSVSEEDRLSLSKAQGAADLEALAQERQAKENADRLAQVKRNLEDLNRLEQPASPAANAQVADGPGAPDGQKPAETATAAQSGDTSAGAASSAPAGESPGAGAGDGLIQRWSRHPWLVPIGSLFLGGLLLVALVRSGRKGPVLPIGGALAHPSVAADLPEEPGEAEDELSEAALRQEVQRLNQHPLSGTAAQSAQAAVAPTQHTPLSFDLSSINLDLDSPPTAAPAEPANKPQRPS